MGWVEWEGTKTPHITETPNSRIEFGVLRCKKAAFGRSGGRDLARVPTVLTGNDDGLLALPLVVLSTVELDRDLDLLLDGTRDRLRSRVSPDRHESLQLESDRLVELGRAVVHDHEVSFGIHRLLLISWRAL